MPLKLSQLDDAQKAKLIENRWKSSDEVWDIVQKTYKANTAVYENRAGWLDQIPQRRKTFRVQANRVFVNQESVINSLIAQPPGINILQARDGVESQKQAQGLETYFRKKYLDLNVKETFRKSYRNLYFGRLFIIKAFWNPAIRDFDFKAIDPNKVRFSKTSNKEQESEFAIEEIDDNLCALCDRFPAKRNELMQKFGFVGEDAEEKMYIENPSVTYKEAWIGDEVSFKYESIILGTIPNPYWDWEGVLITPEEEIQINGTKESPAIEGDARRQLFQKIKLDQDKRKAQQVQTVPEEGVPIDPNIQPEAQVEYTQYFFNYFDNPRKPYIFATIFNNENCPIGRTDMITLSAELQRGIDKRKMDIDENCEFVNGILKVDAAVMTKEDASRIRFETKGVIWGKNASTGVVREVGTPLPEMVFKDMIDSRTEIDNIMAASSAFRGEREGQETKAGRLALIQQSFLRLNELVQLGDSCAKEVFEWGMQLARTRYTEYHKVDLLNKSGAKETIELIQEDIDAGNKVTIIAGKSLPVDDEFKFEQAQNDVAAGFIAPSDYLEIAKYDNAKDLAKNAVKYKVNPVVTVGITPEEMQVLQPESHEEKPPSITINYADVQPDGQVQIMEKIGIKLDPEITVAEKIAEREEGKKEFDLKKQGQEHGQVMSERSQSIAEKEASKPKEKK